MAEKIQAFTMPKWGIEMEEGVIREWHAEEGQTVNEGDLFVVIETDKIANDVELEFTGTLRKRIGEEEEAYPVGALIAVFAEEDVSDDEVEKFAANFKPADASFGDKDDDARPSGKPEKAASSSSQSEVPKGVSISPKAAELAQALGVDVTQIEGSGRKGRISLQDVEQEAKRLGLYQGDEGTQNSDNPHKVIKLTSMRRTIAKRLTEAAQTIPHFYLRTAIVMDSVQELRARAKENNSGGAASINDYLIKACAKALMDVPEANVHFLGDEMHQFDHADISVAVAVPGGLVTPVIKRADTKSVDEIAHEMRDLAARAKAEKLEQHEYRGGTFSLSNLGMFGVTSFDAVVNPPMGAILAAGGIERVAVDGGGEPKFQNVMNVTLSCDHRAIDGALGGRFLQALKAALEAPENL
ncbi:dihydrolipoamide acetyltransferase family protein [Hyphococcus sp.]|uniref:dihydrolipoamide acetyltransferase family protein n=1 Tax=Hyphococcus sp. TaxID=2038636 RepID=UPI003CCC1874